MRQRFLRMLRAVREVLEVVVLALVLFLVLQGTVQNFRVEGSSMEPTLEEGNYLLVNKLVYVNLDMGKVEAVLSDDKSSRSDPMYLFHPPQRGDIIVFRAPIDPDRDFVKRIIALPGETIAFRQGRVYVNGVPLEEPYFQGLSQETREPYTVPPNSYYVMGDNRNQSNDSRHWGPGPVPAENIIGKAWFTYWPRDQANILHLIGLPFWR